MKRILVIGLVAALFGFASPTAKADITQFVQETTVDINSTPLGQSFTADASVGNLSSVLFVITSNAPATTSTAKLFAGAGYGGPLLDTASVFTPGIVPTNSPLSFDFSGNSLTNGGVYTVQVVSDNTMNLQATSTDPYPGGVLVDTSGAPAAGGNFDFKFIISGTPVPEPASLGLLGVGAMGLLTRKRK